MVTRNQVEANRRNARRSTGPRTAEGKARVATNAVKHGLTAKQVILPGEDPAEFEAHRSRFLADLSPRGAVQEFVAEKVVIDAYRLMRVPVWEAALGHRQERLASLEDARAHKSSHEIKEGAPEDTPDIERAAREAHRAVDEKKGKVRTEPVALRARSSELLEKRPTTLANLVRYDTGLLRSFIAGLRELQRLQIMEVGKRVLTPATGIVDGDAAAGSRAVSSKEILYETPPSVEPASERELQRDIGASESTPGRAMEDVGANPDPGLRDRRPSTLAVLVPKRDTTRQKEKTVSVSWIITSRQKAKLRELGYSDEDIAKMKPKHAHRILGIK